MFSVQQIVETNLDSRRILGEVYGGLDRLLFVAGNGCGDYYSYKIEDGEISSTALYRWDHEENSITLVASDLADLIDKYYTDQA